MKRFRQWVVNFVLREEDGQASLLVLNFLVPMFLAFGLMTRVDDSVIMKLRVQNATDAAALEVGTLTARVMNQITLHNNSILKYHSLMAALEAAIDGADRALQLAQQEKRDAESQRACWAQVAVEAQIAIDPPNCPGPPPLCNGDPDTFGTRGNDQDLEQTVLRVANGCVQFLSRTEIPNWDKTINFWTDELQWLRDKKDSVENEIGNRLAADMNTKSQNMLNELNDEIRNLMDDLEIKHRVDELFVSSEGNLLQPGDVDTTRFLTPTGLGQSGYEAISMGGVDQTQQIIQDQRVMGFKHFEATPARFGGNSYDDAGTIAARDGGTDRQPGPFNEGNGNWGPAPYYLEFIKNVHFGLPGYFNFATMHGPLGNADTDMPDCGAPQDQHPGCDTDHGQGPNPCPTDRLRQPTLYCQLGQCNEDQDTYTRDQALQDMDSALPQKNSDQFSGGQEQVVLLSQNPKLEWIVAGRVNPNLPFRSDGSLRRFFAVSFPANTLSPNVVEAGPRVSNPTRDNFGRERYNALSKFRLYNLTEGEGEILEPNEFDLYPDSMLTQDWNVLLAPIDWALDGAGGGLTRYAVDAMRH